MTGLDHDLAVLHGRSHRPAFARPHGAHLVRGLLEPADRGDARQRRFLGGSPEDVIVLLVGGLVVLEVTRVGYLVAGSRVEVVLVRLVGRSVAHRACAVSS